MKVEEFVDPYLGQSWGSLGARVLTSGNQVSVTLGYPAAGLQADLAVQLAAFLRVDTVDLQLNLAVKGGSGFGQVKHIVLVSSGKGGVGKSTVAVNLACALAAQGLRVGLLDADIYGPSQPKMLGLNNSKVEIKNKKISPKKIGNLSMMSMGMLFPEHEAIIWRGPMLMKGLQQLLLDVAWDNQDFFIVDLPPGTGDIHITLAQKVIVSGAIVISTPQDISLLDAKKAIALYNKTNTKILGLIENMSYFECSKCGEKHNIFSSGGVKKVTNSENLAHLGSIPLSKDIMECADNGTPYVLHNTEGKELFSVIVKNILKQLNPI